MALSNKTAVENLPISTTPPSPHSNNSASMPSGSRASIAKPLLATTPPFNSPLTIPTSSKASRVAPTLFATTTMSAPTTPSTLPSDSTSSKLSSPAPKIKTSASLLILYRTTLLVATPRLSIPSATSVKTTKRPNSSLGTTSTTSSPDRTAPLFSSPPSIPRKNSPPPPPLASSGTIKTTASQASKKKSMASSPPNRNEVALQAITRTPGAPAKTAGTRLANSTTATTSPKAPRANENIPPLSNPKCPFPISGKRWMPS